jgi:hypothetical protein
VKGERKDGLLVGRIQAMEAVGVGTDHEWGNSRRFDFRHDVATDLDRIGPVWLRERLAELTGKGECCPPGMVLLDPACGFPMGKRGGFVSVDPEVILRWLVSGLSRGD